MVVGKTSPAAFEISGLLGRKVAGGGGGMPAPRDVTFLFFFITLKPRVE